MHYSSRSELSIIELERDEESVSFSRLEKKIISSPSNIIYCEKNNKLFGIISMGDIKRSSEAGLDYVHVNTCFTKLGYGDHMQARRFFAERPSINAIPICDENGVLIGHWTRWGCLYNEIFYKAKMAWQNKSFFENIHIALVHPCYILEEKQETFDFIHKKLKNLGILIDCISYDTAEDYFGATDYILFVDEEELRAFQTLYMYIYNKDISKGKKSFITVERFFKDVVYHAFISMYLLDIYKKGVYVLNLRFEDNQYFLNLAQRVHDKFHELGRKVSSELLPEMYSDFFDNLYTEEYVDDILNLNFEVETKSGQAMLKDCSGKHYNVINGERVTVGQPHQYQKTIYFIGPCFIYGHYVEDKNTIESILQQKLNDNGYQIRVINCGSPSYSIYMELAVARIIKTQLRRGDIIVTYALNHHVPYIPELNLMDILENKNVNINWIVDAPMHCNHKVYAMYAEAVYEALKPILSEKRVEGLDKGIAIDSDFVKRLYIDRYFKDFNAHMYNKIGGIVMNCNPFTYGHRYLIEQALNIVDFLIIFVVEEDKSAFSFAERFAMVSEGIADLSDVMAVPSGPFILSQTTFPEYFIKAMDENLTENTGNDITIFAEKIAPHLNIRYRFVGEEPEDAVTNEYNSAMKSILHGHGIELIEIPRKELGGRYICASSARKYLENNDSNNFKKIVPESTVKVLFG